jgi:hypothetical protein
VYNMSDCRDGKREDLRVTIYTHSQGYPREREQYDNIRSVRSGWNSVDDWCFDGVRCRNSRRVRTRVDDSSRVLVEKSWVPDVQSKAFPCLFGPIC